MHAAMASFIKRYGHHFGYSNSVEFLHSKLIIVVTFDDIKKIKLINLWQKKKNCK